MNHKSGQKLGLIHHVNDVRWIQGEHVGRAPNSDMYAPCLERDFLTGQADYSWLCVWTCGVLHAGGALKPCMRLVHCLKLGHRPTFTLCHSQMDEPIVQPLFCFMYYVLLWTQSVEARLEWVYLTVACRIKKVDCIMHRVSNFVAGQRKLAGRSNRNSKLKAVFMFCLGILHTKKDWPQSGYHGCMAGIRG